MVTPSLTGTPARTAELLEKAILMPEAARKAKPNELLGSAPHAFCAPARSGEFRSRVRLNGCAAKDGRRPSILGMAPNLKRVNI